MSIRFAGEKGLNQPFTLVGLDGTEGISQLYRYQLELVADPAKSIDFNQFLGRRVSVEIPGLQGNRRIHGIVRLLTQAGRDQRHAYYRAEIVPRLWLLTKIAQSRIFQDLDAKGILEAVLDEASTSVGFFYSMQDVAGTYPQRPYCVQYRETDFNFLSRLMEDEGIYYYFRQSEDEEELVLADAPLIHPDVAGTPAAKLDESRGGYVPEERVRGWSKTQELRSGQYTLWDHSFELPASHLDAQKAPTPQVHAGPATHRFDTPFGKQLEIYDYPGDYAQRFDGVNRGGGDDSAKLQGVFDDSQRTAAIRMQQEALPGLIAHGAGTCRLFQPGFKFTLEVQDGRGSAGWKPEGKYLLTAVEHRATQSVDGSRNPQGFEYHNQFSCVPVELPFRPLQRTPRPTIPGTQTAVVIGSGADGEEIYTDKYGRVKVRFFWDRRTPKAKDMHPDSCWIRVAQLSAGKRWGASFWPRIGQEVVVAFEEGEPDRPIIIGSVYNAEQMPAYLGGGLDGKHKNDNKVSGIKTNTSPGGKGYNELRFDDTKDKEQIFLHAQRSLDTRVQGDSRERVGHDRHLVVGGQDKDGNKAGDQREQIFQDKHLNVKRHQEEHIEGSLKLTVGHGGAKDNPGNVEVVIEKTRKELIGQDDHRIVKQNQKGHVGGSQDLTVSGAKKETIGGPSHLHVDRDRNEQFGGTHSLTVGQNQQEKVGQKHALEAGQEIHLKAGMTVVIEAGVQLTLKGPGGFVDISPAGVTIQGTMVLINSGGSAGSGSGCSPQTPEDATYPDEAQKAQPLAPNHADDSASGKKSAPGP